MTPIECVDLLALFEDKEPMARVFRNRTPAVPPLGQDARVQWLDFVSGDGGTLRISDNETPQKVDRELRVVLLDDHTVAFWLTPDGQRLGWMLAGSA